MIYEFALEPELVASWVDRSAYRFFDGKFGKGTTRAPSTFPKDSWHDQVRRAFKTAFRGTDAERQAAEYRLEALISFLSTESTKREGSCPQSAWHAGVRREHLRRPFHAVVVRRAGGEGAPPLCHSSCHLVAIG